MPLTFHINPHVLDGILGKPQPDASGSWSSSMSGPLSVPVYTHGGHSGGVARKEMPDDAPDSKTDDVAGSVTGRVTADRTSSKIEKREAWCQHEQNREKPACKAWEANGHPGFHWNHNGPPRKRDVIGETDTKSAGTKEVSNGIEKREAWCQHEQNRKKPACKAWEANGHPGFHWNHNGPPKKRGLDHEKVMDGMVTVVSASPAAATASATSLTAQIPVTNMQTPLIGPGGIVSGQECFSSGSCGMVGAGALVLVLGAMLGFHVASRKSKKEAARQELPTFEVQEMYSDGQWGPREKVAAGDMV